MKFNKDIEPLHGFGIMWMYATLFLSMCTAPASAQVITAYPMIPVTQDTILFMSDHLPKGIKYWPFRTDSNNWDLNGVKAPFIRRLILTREDPSFEFFKKANAFAVLNQTTREYLRIAHDSIISYGINGVDLFNDGHYYKGYYDVPRLYKSNKQHEHAAGYISAYKLTYDCGISQLPATIQSQLPYTPDSIRIVTSIEEQSSTRPSVTLDLNLQRYHAFLESKTIIQRTRLETRKSNLSWQDVTRFIKFPKLFRVDTLRISSFYTDSLSTPVASLYYKSNDVLEKIIYRAPDTFKDLIVVDDFKPNLFFFPNPYSAGTLRCEMIIKNPGLYTARIVSLIGNEIWRQNYYLEYSHTLDLDISYLNKGTYFFVLEQDKNHVVATKRLLVMKP
jgi:hypothetical protein